MSIWLRMLYKDWAHHHKLLVWVDAARDVVGCSLPQWAISDVGIGLWARTPVLPRLARLDQSLTSVPLDDPSVRCCWTKKSRRSDASAESIVWSDRSVTITKEDSVANVKNNNLFVRVQVRHKARVRWACAGSQSLLAAQGRKWAAAVYFPGTYGILNSKRNPSRRRTGTGNWTLPGHSGNTKTIWQQGHNAQVLNSSADQRQLALISPSAAITDTPTHNRARMS